MCTPEKTIVRRGSDHHQVPSRMAKSSEKQRIPSPALGTTGHIRETDLASVIRKHLWLRESKCTHMKQWAAACQMVIITGTA